MGIFGLAISSGAATLGKAAVAGGGGRVVTGAILGGIYGGATSENKSSTGTFSDIMKGAMGGAALGGLTTRTFASAALRPGTMARAYKGARGMGAGRLEALSFGRYASSKTPLLSRANQNVRGLANLATKGAWGVAKGVGRAGWSVGSAVARNPYRSLGYAAVGTGVGLGAYSLVTSGPGSGGVSVDEMSAIATAHGQPSTGFAPGMGSSMRQESRAMFIDSTYGLVQGMNAGRHR